MELKNKAGLALALAAIFTTGGANLALAADNNTFDGGDIPVAGSKDAAQDAVLPGATDSGFTATPTLNVPEGGGFVKTVVVAEGTTSLDLKGNDPLTVTTGRLVTAGGNGPAPDVTSTAPIIVDANSSTDIEVDAVYDLPRLVINSGKGLVITGKGKGKNATLNAGTLELVANSLADGILVGDATNKGALIVDKATLNGNKIFADPDFDTNGIYGPSQVVINTFGTPTTGNAIDGILIAGQNSTFTIGAKDSTFVNSVIADIGIDQFKETGGYNAAMAFIGPQVIDIAKGALTIDGSLTAPDGTTANGINFKNNSLVAFDLTGVGNATGTSTGKAALSAVTSGTHDKIGAVMIGGTPGATPATTDAGIYFHNANSKTLYTILDDVTNLTLNGASYTAATTEVAGDKLDGALGHNWTGDDLHFSSGLLDGTWHIVKNSDNSYDVNLETEYNGKINTVMPDLSDGMANAVANLWTEGLNATEFDATKFTNGISGYTNDRGIQFVSLVVEELFADSNTYTDTELAAVLEGAGQIAVAGGVPYLTSNVITQVSSLIVDHNNILNAIQPAYGNEPGQLGIWATPFYGLSDVDGMSAGGFESGSEVSYGGAAFGIDYNVNEAFRLGAALNLGGGSSDSEGNGDFSNTENDFDFFGGSIYGSYSNGAFGLTGDIGYSSVDNDIEQAVPGFVAQAMGTSKFHSDVDSDAFTIGLTGKYRFAVGENLNVAPHLGLRYTKISTDSSQLKMDNGEALYNIDTDDQNLFQIPLGVEFSNNIVTDGGWTVTPRADLGVLFTVGDTDVDTRSRFAVNGGDAGAFNADVVDSAAFTGTLGIKAQADNGLSLGLDYGILASGNQTDHQFTGMLRFEF